MSIIASLMLSISSVNDFNALLNDKQLTQAPVPMEKPAANKARIWVIRHGQSDSNANPEAVRIAGRTINSPLTDLGVTQSAAAGNLLKDKGIRFEAYYVSPLDRAITTIETIRSVMGNEVRVNVEADLIETFYGKLEGATGLVYDPAEKRMQKDLPALPDFASRMSYRMVSDMENMQEVFDRVKPVLLEIAKKNIGKDVVAITHNGPVKALFMRALADQMNAEIMYHTHKVDNCAILCFESDGTTLELKYINGITYKP